MRFRDLAARITRLVELETRLTLYAEGKLELTAAEAKSDIEEFDELRSARQGAEASSLIH